MEPIIGRRRRFKYFLSHQREKYNNSSGRETTELAASQGTSILFLQPPYSRISLDGSLYPIYQSMEAPVDGVFSETVGLKKSRAFAELYL